MSLNHSYIERSEGARLIVEYCEDLADELNIELIKTPYWVLPIIDPILVSESTDLIIEATTGSAKIKISRDAIEGYSEKVGNEEVDANIIIALKNLSSEN